MRPTAGEGAGRYSRTKNALAAFYQDSLALLKATVIPSVARNPVVNAEGFPVATHKSEENFSGRPKILARMLYDSRRKEKFFPFHSELVKMPFDRLETGRTGHKLAIRATGFWDALKLNRGKGTQHMSAQDENLLAQARTGNQEALSELLLKYLPHTEARLRKKFTTALRQWQSFLDIRDILQITAMQALLDFPGFHGHAAQFEHWLGHIAGNDFRDAIRWLESRTPAGTRLQPPEGRNFLEWLWDLVDETGPTPSARLKAQEQREILQQAVQALPVSWASVIRLLFFEEKSIEETAALMKRTPAALYVLRLRALKRLRELLGTQFFSK